MRKVFKSFYIFLSIPLLAGACEPHSIILYDGTELSIDGRVVKDFLTDESFVFPEAICGVLRGPNKSFLFWSRTGGIFAIVAGKPVPLFHLHSKIGETLLCAATPNESRLIVVFQNESTIRINNIQPGVASSDWQAVHSLNHTGDSLRCDIAPDGCGALLWSRGSSGETTFLDLNALTVRSMPDDRFNDPVSVSLESDCAAVHLLQDSGAYLSCDLIGGLISECTEIAKLSDNESWIRRHDGSILPEEEFLND